ncbi:DM13 domain-containing protein [uncultured Tateyamaria sp.]|uniref:DM13 domain-containing protein n=1 Tax=Tateyamaria sp. 1078 TaxID=3417464 RepID=UPI002631D05B|nr:DM13 domain-containing protein [uncultured Tateyamaria sp.]
MLKFIPIALAAVLSAAISLAGIAANAGPVATGTFTGASDHITTGSVEIVANADGSHTIVLGDDFSLDGAPDPRVGLGKNGYYDGNTDSGKLLNLTGSQSFTVPAGVDISDFNEVYIWCEKFSVPLGFAVLG